MCRVVQEDNSSAITVELFIRSRRFANANDTSMTKHCILQKMPFAKIESLLKLAHSFEEPIDSLALSKQISIIFTDVKMTDLSALILVITRYSGFKFKLSVRSKDTSILVFLTIEKNFTSEQITELLSF